MFLSQKEKDKKDKKDKKGSLEQDRTYSKYTYWYNSNLILT